MTKHFDGICTRSVEFTPVERAADSEDPGDGRTLSGYAAVFNTPTEINSPFEGRFVEQIAPGAFRKTLRERKPILQYDHGRDSRVGSTPIGVYTELREDEQGLFVKGRLFDNSLVEPVRQAIEAQALTGMSFRFQVVRDEWRDNTDKVVRGDEVYRLLGEPGDRGPLKRTIKELKCFEAGPVASPAYSQTSVGVRSVEDLTDDERDSMAAEYRDSLIQSSEDEAAGAVDILLNPVTEDVQASFDENRQSSEWLEAERQWQWYEAENLYRWVEAEREFTAAHISDLISQGFTTEQLTRWLEAEDTFRWLAAESEFRAKDKKPYGDVNYADPGHQKDGVKRYPLSSKKKVKAAWSYINMPKNAAKYTPEQLASVKAKVKAAAVKFGIKTDETKSADENSAVRENTLSESVTPESNAVPIEDTLPIRDSKKDADTSATRIIRKARVMTLSELRERLAFIDTRREQIGEEFEDRSLPEDVQTEWDSLDTERSKVEKMITGIETRLAALKVDAGRTGGHVEHGQAPAVHITPDNIYDVEAIRNSATSTDQYRDLLRDNAMRAVDKAHYGGGKATDKAAAQEGIEFLLSGSDRNGEAFAKHVLDTGSPLYERAWSKAVAAGSPQGLSPDEYRALALGTDNVGGYAVPFQLDPTVILTSAGVINPLRDIARVERIVGKEWQGITTAGATVSRAAEAAEASDNSFVLAQPVVRTNRVQGFIPFSYELADTWDQVRSEITRALVDAKAREEATSFVTGDGTGVNANGVIGTLVGNTVNATTGQTVVARNIYSLEEALDPRFRTSNAKFLGHRSIYNTIRNFDTAGGAQLWERIGAGMPGQLLGYDALESSVMATTPATGNKFLLFGDFENFLIVDRVGMSVELIPQVFGSNQRPTGQRGIFAIWQNNSKILVPSAFKVLLGIA